MIRRRTVIVMISLLSAPAMADLVVPKDRDGQDVDIHAAADSGSAELGSLAPGEFRQVHGGTSHWYEIRMSDGTPGFVSKRATTLIRTPPARDIDELRIHYLNVGSGACTIIECPGADAPPMIVDCGSVGNFTFDLEGVEATGYVASVLAAHDTAPNVVISHPHTDHYDLIPEILGEVQADNIWLGGNESGYRFAGFPDWRAAQVSGGAEVHANHPADFHNDQDPMDPQVLGCGLADVYTLTVNSGDGPNPNSHVMEIRYNDFGATFTGDAERITEEQADANHDGNVKTTVLSASHHGASSHGSNNSDWIEATDPEIVVFSSGPLFGHPRCNVTARYDPTLAAAPAHATHCGDNTGFRRDNDTRIAKYVTATNGLIVITTDGSPPARLFCDGQTSCSTEIDH